MHLIESYSTNTGLKISKPKLYTKYFPLPFKKYLVFHPHSKPVKTYDYWTEVLDLIIPHLHHNGIHVVQIGDSGEEQYPNTYFLAGRTKLTQVNYLIQNSLMVFGVDSFSMHVASVFGKKIVSLYSNNNINNVRPYWSDKEDIELIEPKREGTKPYYATDGVPKEINTIKPELIASAILNKLGFQGVKFDLTCEYLGAAFKNKIVEIVPNMVAPPSTFGSNQIIIRMDLEFNEQCLNEQLKTGQGIIITNKPISIDLLKINKNNILQIIYKLEDNYDLSFAKELTALGVNHVFVTFKADDTLKKIKLDFMDIGIVHIKEARPVKSVIKSNGEVFYKNGRFILSNNRVYPSVYAYRNNIPIDGIAVRLNQLFDINTNDFNEEIDHYIFYSKPVDFLQLNAKLNYGFNK